MKLCFLSIGLAGAVATGDCVWSTSKWQLELWRGKFVWGSTKEARCTSKEGSLLWEEVSRQNQKCSKHGYLVHGYQEMLVTPESERACSLEPACVWDNRTNRRKCEPLIVADQQKKYKESEVCEVLKKDQCAKTKGCGYTMGDLTMGPAGKRCTTRDTADRYFSKAFQDDLFCSPQTKVGCENISFPLWVKNACSSHEAIRYACRQNVSDKWQSTGTACDEEKGMLVCDRAHPCYDIPHGAGSWTGVSMRKHCERSSKGCNLVCSESTKADKAQLSSLAGSTGSSMAHRRGVTASATGRSMAHRSGVIASATVMSWLTLHFQSPR